MIIKEGYFYILSCPFICVTACIILLHNEMGFISILSSKGYKTLNGVKPSSLRHGKYCHA